MALRAFALLLSCAACSAEPGGGASDVSAAAATADGSPLILYDAPFGRPYMQALTGGVLERDGNCTYLAAGDRRTLLLLPSPTTRWDAAAGAIRFGERTYRFGDTAAFGGGEVPIGSGPEAAEARRRGCDTNSVWWASPEDVDPAILRRPPPVAPPPPPSPPPPPAGGAG